MFIGEVNPSFETSDPANIAGPQHLSFSSRSLCSSPTSQPLCPLVLTAGILCHLQAPQT